MLNALPYRELRDESGLIDQSSFLVLAGSHSAHLGPHFSNIRWSHCFALILFPKRTKPHALAE